MCSRTPADATAELYFLRAVTGFIADMMYSIGF